MPHLTVFIEKAYNLPITDIIGNKSDPYCKVRIKSNPGMTTYKTKTCKRTLDPVWDTPFEFKMNSLENEVLEFRLFDANLLRSKLMDCVEFDLSRLIRGQTVKKVFRVAGTKDNLVGQLYVRLTANDFGRPMKSIESRIESVSKRVNLQKAFKVFGVEVTGNLVKDYKVLRSKIHEWRAQELTLEKIATLTFHCYDSGCKGYLSLNDVTRIANHLLSSLMSSSSSLLAVNTKRQLQKWEKHKIDTSNENYSREEFASLASDLLKDEHFINKQPITRIGDRYEITKFVEQVLAVLGVLGFENSNVNMEMYDTNLSSSESGIKAFNIATYICPQKRPVFSSNLAQVLFEYYHVSYAEDEEPIDVPANWRMSIADMEHFLGHTDNKMKNVNVKQPWESYSLADFKIEFSKLSEFDFDTNYIR